LIEPSDRLARALAALQGHYPRSIELSLDRISDLLEALGRPQDRLPPVIHVAGTNGKGSTCAFLRAMAEAAGLRVHVYSSPHLVRFNERVRLAGELISDAAFADALERTGAALGEGQITHFEATTAAALLAFSETPADLLVLEVGLGGRYDATNVIDTSDVAVISPVDFDHKQFLGDDLAGIAGEKAGIIRSGSPVVSARQSPVVAEVIAARARDLGARLHVLGEDDLERVETPLALQGSHQLANAALAAKALEVWGDRRITPLAIREGSRRAAWPARMQKLADGAVTAMGRGAEVWLDGGHNPHAARAVAALLAGRPGACVLVAAMMASKDAEGFFAAFAGLAPRVFTIPNAEGHEGRPPDELAEAARRVGLEARPCRTLGEAMEAAAGLSPARILICGSLYLAGDVLAMNGELPD
jgi:dihydrofolate synthase/folylpolyglutamate synthase